MADLEFRPCACANCEWTGREDQTREVRDFWSRMEPGDTMPAGECPECGAMAFLVQPPAALQVAARTVLFCLDSPLACDVRPFMQGAITALRAALGPV